jgi:hypothetical protein
LTGKVNNSNDEEPLIETDQVVFDGIVNRLRNGEFNKSKGVEEGRRRRTWRK